MRGRKGGGKEEKEKQTKIIREKWGLKDILEPALCVTPILCKNIKRPTEETMTAPTIKWEFLGTFRCDETVGDGWGTRDCACEHRKERKM